MSYTNKDFNSIYSELLDTAKNLTTKWDPSQSNESDPGVVLIKEDAIIGDKNNYNIDKNVLELFPLSVTQVGNARKIYDFAGYQMHWYIAASTDITIKYTGELDSDTNFVIPEYYAFTNADRDIVYTYVPSDLDEGASVSNKQRTITISCLQGIRQQYDVNGNKVINFANLDSQQRLFFPYQNVAENGIFVKTHGTEVMWKKVDNLESYAPSSTIFKFGVLPNTNVCYIQFPQDIQYIIGAGLEIDYLTTLGEGGNVSANVIDSVYSDEKIDDNISLVDNAVITNRNATSDGADPEDLDSAYENYKRTVGTFNTLVTCRDYENALINSGEVSNCVVSDRTNDLYASYRTMVADGMSNHLVDNVRTKFNQTYEFSGENIVLGKDTVITDIEPQVGNTGNYIITYNALSMSAYDLVLRLLTPMSSTVNATTYNKSFTRYSTSPEEYVGEELLANNKSCQHNFASPITIINSSDTVDTSTRPYLFKNFYTLRGTLLTYTKLTSEEIKEVETNARNALYEKFNSSKVNFGEQVRYEDIVETLQNSDTRIKAVILNEDLNYDLRALLPKDEVGDTSTQSLDDSDFDSYKIDCLVQMILRGNVSLYDFNKDFALEFGETETTIYPKSSDSDKDITSITTEVDIQTTKVEDKIYKVSSIDDENVNIVAYTPNYIDKKVYTYYVTIKNQTSAPLPVGKLIKVPAVGLGGNPSQAIKCSWTDENNKLITEFISSDTSSSPSIIEIELANSSVESIGAGEEVNLGVSGTLTVKEKNTKPLPAMTKFIFFTNNFTYRESDKSYTFTLFNVGESERVLNVDEYLIYTNDNMDELVVLGSGTLITRSATTNALTFTTVLDPEEIFDKGLNVVSDTDWKAVDYDMSITELKIATLGKGTTNITINNSKNPETMSLDNTHKHIDSISYMDTDGAPGELLNEIDGCWVFSRLNLLASPTDAQKIPVGGSIVLNMTNYTTQATATATLQAGTSFKTNRPAAIVGGVNVSAMVTYVDDGGIVNDYSLKVLGFTGESITAYVDSTDVSDKVIEITNTGEYIINTKGQSGNVVLTLPLSANYYTLFKIDLHTFGGDITVGNAMSPTSLTDAGVYIIKAHPEQDNQKVILTIPGRSETYPAGTILYIGKPYITDYLITNWVEVDTAQEKSGLSKEVRGTLDAINAVTSSAYRDFGKACYGDEDTHTKGAFEEYNFDELYQVQDIDKIDTSVLVVTKDSLGNECCDIFQPSALWDINHLWNRFTIPQLNTRDTTIQVAKASRK